MKKKDKDKKNVEDHVLPHTNEYGLEKTMIPPSMPQYGLLLKEENNFDIKRSDLDFKDYIALTIALLQTVFLPFFVLMAIFLILALIARLILLL